MALMQNVKNGSHLKGPYFYLIEPLVDMRESPRQQSKVVSQAVLSEEIKVHKFFEDWSYVTSSDGYFGWLPTNSFIKRATPYSGSLKVSRLKAHIYQEKDIEYGPIKTIPYDVKLQKVDESDPRWIKIALPNEDECYIQKGDLTQCCLLQNKEDLIPFSQQFLGLPYTWGGRSSFGFDCSGFVQMLYSQIGIHLVRDSNQQILDPRFCDTAIDHLQAGDLIFFGKSKEQIKHVGMFIGDQKFIHATARENQPWIRISQLFDAEWSGESQQYYSYRMGRSYNKI